MMNKQIVYTVLLGLLFCTACTEEENSKPRGGEDEAYILPQGDHDYDARIVNWHDRTGSYILYKFSDRDAYWWKSTWQEAVLDEEGKPTTSTRGLTIKPAEEAYVPRLLEFVENNYFNFFSTDFLRKALPIRVLLCSTLQDYSRGNIRPYDYYFGKETLYFGKGDARMDAITPAERKSFRDRLLKETLDKALAAGIVEIPEEFSSVSTYYQACSSQDMYKRGFLRYYAYSYQAKYVTPEWDWDNYITYIIQNPYTVLTAEPAAIDWSLPKGILHPSKDTEGLVRKKYDAVIKYFKEKHGIDLQAMGDYVE